MQQIESKIEDQDETITGLKNNDYDNMVAIDEIQQYQRRDCLEITGIPTLPNDKPKNIVMELGATLGV
jgi:hypothetical protein